LSRMMCANGPLRERSVLWRPEISLYGVVKLPKTCRDLRTSASPGLTRHLSARGTGIPPRQRHATTTSVQAAGQTLQT